MIYFSSEPSKKSCLVIILIFTITVILDSTIVKFAAYTGLQLQTLSNIAIFVTFSGVLLMFSIYFMNLIRKRLLSTQTPIANMKYIHILFFCIQFIILSGILIIILQMFILDKYNIGLVRIDIYLSFITALFFIVLLIFMLIRWFRLQKNYKILLFAISFSFLCVNIIISTIYLDSYFSKPIKIFIKPYKITSFITNFAGSSLNQQLALVSDMLSIISFSFMWLSMAFLLSHYRYKLGIFKYLAIISIPLVYYIFPFEAYFGNIFFTFILESPVIFGIIYVLIFSATQQIGALFFSLFFLIASTLVAKSNVRYSILISGIGIAIVFGSLEIATLQYSVYPPFGLITTAFMPLGAYLLFIGIVSSADNISRNIYLRKELYKDASNQLGLLKEIGIAQMENKLIGKYKYIIGHTHIRENEFPKELGQEEIGEIVKDVLREISKKKLRDEDHK